MGMRFRKSVKIGKNAKLNINKKSVGISVGGKHGRVSVNSKGRKTTSVGVPGTGLSYVKSSKIGGRNESSGNITNNINSKSKSNGGTKIRVIIVIVVLLIVISIFRSCGKSDLNNETAAEKMSASHFATLFVNDPDTAEVENKNKVFEITGYIEDISEYSYKIEFKPSQMIETFTEYSIVFNFKKSDYKNLPEDISEGDELTIKARFDKVASDILLLKDAIYISK